MRSIFAQVGNQIKIFFSNRIVGILCTLVSIAAINSIQQTIGNLGWDNSFSIAAAKNMYEGHGYSIRLASPEDIAKTVYEPLNKWPPGYSILLLIIHAISSLDWIESAFLLNAIGLTLLVLVFKKMLLQLEFPKWIVNLSVLYFGFIFHSFLGVYFTDIFALLFFMIGCSILLKYVNGGQSNIILVVLSALFFSLSAWLKYLYFGLAFIPLASLFYFGWKRKIKKIKVASKAGLIVAGILIFLLVYFQLRNTGSMIYIKPSSATGFFPSQLLGLAPIVPGTFLNLDFINMQISTHLFIPYQSVFLLWSIVNILCLFCIAFIGWPIIKNPEYLKEDFLVFYTRVVLWVSAFIFIFLGLLTVHFNSHYKDMMYPWVFVGIPRYFSPVCFFIFQFIIYLFLKPNFFPKKVVYYLFCILLVCVVIEEISHTTYFVAKKIFFKKEFGLKRPDDQRELRASHFVNSELEKTSQTVVCAGIPEISNFCSLSGISSIMDYSLFQKPIRCSKEVLIITTLDSFSVKLMPVEFFKLDTRLVAHQSGYLYYFTFIHPNKGFEKF